MKVFRQINWSILSISFVFAFLETRFFGWNWHAQSPAEMICDGISLLILALAFLDVRRGKP